MAPRIHTAGHDGRPICGLSFSSRTTRSYFETTCLRCRDMQIAPKRGPHGLTPAEAFDEHCPGDDGHCYVGAGTDDAHWRCGTSACPHSRKMSDEDGPTYRDKNDAPLTVGDNVRVHTGEEGVVDGFIANRTECVHVLIRPGFGGTYFPFECEKRALGADEIERDASAWYSAGQIEEMEG